MRQILVDASDVVLEEPEWDIMVQNGRVAPYHIDWRRCPFARREYLAKDLAITNCETITTGEMLELGTVLALMGELQERIQVDEDTMLVDPSNAKMWACLGLETSVKEPTPEELAHIEKVRNARHLYIVVHSEGPRHYTELEVHKNEENTEVSPPTLLAPKPVINQ